MKRRDAGLLGVALATFASGAQSQYISTPPRLNGGPTDAEIAAAWPNPAKQAGIQGEVRIECKVSAKAEVGACQVLRETPTGQGFGQAALGLISKFRAEAAKVNNEPTGGVVRFILNFPPNPAATGPAVAGPYTLPEAVEKPTEAELFAAWPGVARANHVEGWATLACTISLYGHPQDCVVGSESRAGLGFGEGAMRVIGRYRFLPGTKDTMAVPMRIPVQVQFECKTRCTPFVLPDDFKGELVSAAWTQVPSVAELIKASPKGLPPGVRGAKALLFCKLKADGGAERCRVMSEEPKGIGVGAAALALVPQFKTVTPKQFVGAGVQIPVAFSSEIGRPILNRRPVGDDYGPLMNKAAADPKVTEASVMLSCTVAGGALSNCTASGESPAGVGLAEPALALAPKFGVSLWGENGRPTEGSPIKVPLSLSVRGPPEPAEQPVLTISQPQWISRPTAVDVERYYPERALSAERSGVVTLYCKVGGDGGLFDCTVTSEAPTGMGFGAAALKLAPIFKMKTTTIEGEPVAGANVTVPIIFRLN